MLYRMRRTACKRLVYPLEGGGGEGTPTARALHHAHNDERHSDDATKHQHTSQKGLIKQAISTFYQINCKLILDVHR
jgi:phage gp29-like protein